MGLNGRPCLKFSIAHQLSLSDGSIDFHAPTNIYGKHNLAVFYYLFKNALKIRNKASALAFPTHQNTVLKIMLESLTLVCFLRDLLSMPVSPPLACECLGAGNVVFPTAFYTSLALFLASPGKFNNCVLN